MHPSLILRILGILLMLFSLTMLAPALVSLWDSDAVYWAFTLSFIITFTTGLMLWLLVYRSAHHTQDELSIRDGFLITSLFWTVLALFGSLPFLLSPDPDISITDAVFESVSGLTTTGATILTGLDFLPTSILLYRQLLQWLGGIGIIVIAVAILPMLGIGGMQLYRAEMPGPLKDKLTPRITETAKALFLVYLLLTVLCGLAYWLAGMSSFDAIAHAFSTVSLGGMSTHDTSMGYFKSPKILLICTLFMLIAGINFALHFYTLRWRRMDHYTHDTETTFYGYTMLGAITIVCIYLILSDDVSFGEGLLYGVFQTVSVATTTGFTTVDYAHWPRFLPIFLVTLSFMGGCAGSTSGGMKVIRVMLIAKQGVREFGQLIHPNAVIPLKVGRHRVEAKEVSALWSFCAIYLCTFIVILMLLVATGLDYTTAFSAVAASLNNLGPGLGGVFDNYIYTPIAAKWLLSFAMLLGRLEIFTLLVIFSPAFWRS